VTLYNGHEVVGNVSFVQEHDEGIVKINGTISGLKAGEHGFHVHEKGDVRNDCNAAGGHFNPEKVNILLLYILSLFVVPLDDTITVSHSVTCASMYYLPYFYCQ